MRYPVVFVVVLSMVLSVALPASAGWRERQEAREKARKEKADSRAGCYILTPWPWIGRCSAKDADGDGVADDMDRCPGSPEGAKVDRNGCCIDTDGDGVPDGLDICPESPKGAKVDKKGCIIDSDGDGVPDGLDRCPGTPTGATVDKHGCQLDSDGDGIPDDIDRCPGTVKGARVDENGCPVDTDGDGVYDGLDRCPNTPEGEEVDEEGCTVEAREFIDTGMLTTTQITFETDRSELEPESREELDRIGRILSQAPGMRIEIAGHTDSAGSEIYNRQLSEDRAMQVRSYLLREFPVLKDENLVARGYGESEPVASNDTAGGRAKNRRVEFRILEK